MLKTIKHLLERSSFFISILLTLIIIYLSLSSLKELNVKISVSDKFLHSLAYLALTYSWLFSIKKSHSNNKIKSYIGIILIIFGIILEVLQSSMPLNRQGDIIDVLANSLGVVFALVTFNTLHKYYKVI